MKILLMISNVFGVGGMERVTCQLANILYKKGHKVSILSLWLNSDKPYFELDEDIKIIKLSNKPPSAFELYFKMPLKIRQIIETENIERIIVSDSQLSITAGFASTGFQTKVIVWEHFHAQMGQLFGSRWFGRWFAAWFCNQIVVLTEYDKKAWFKKYKTKDKIKVIPNVLTIALSLTSYDLSNRNIIAVGRFTEVKGFDLLVQAWALLPNYIRKEWKLRLIGPNSSCGLREKVEMLIDELFLHESVELVAPTPFIGKEYKNAAMLVSSSREESFGLAIIEALAHKLPVVAFDCPVGPKEILQNKYGICVPDGDIKSLTKSISSLISSTEKRLEYSKLAYERAQDFTEDKIIILWEEILI